MARFFRHPSLVLCSTAYFVLTLAAAACGTAAGYLLGRIVVQNRAEMIADQFVLRIQSVVASAQMDSSKVLTELTASPYAPCSDEDLTWMRKLVFQSDYLNEAGRMRGEHLLCSAALGRVSASPEYTFKPDLVFSNGMKIYLNPGPYRRANMTIIGVQNNGQFVIFRPTVQAFFASAPLQYAVTRLDALGSRQYPAIGTLHNAPLSILTQQGELRRGKAVYATRCELDAATCITASISLADAMKYGRFGVEATTAFGAILGALLPLLAYGFGSSRRTMEGQLRRAIRGGKLYMVYMPIVELASRRVIGAEALVRWDDSAGYPVSPEVFVRLAEERGFVTEITRLVVRRVLDELGEHLRDHPEFSISVNATATDLADPEFPTLLELNLEKACVAPQSVIVEITESSTVRQAAARDSIYRLRQMGTRVHIDDFGTGYSSLAYLHELSVDAVKIDKSFVQTIGTDAVARTILPQIMAMADALHLEIVVEGIETEQQASYFLDPTKHRLAQGWLFGAPVPIQRFAELYLAREKPAGTAKEKDL